MDASTRPLPEPTDLTLPFWQAAKAGRLDLQYCTDCAGFQFYPRPCCVRCGSTALQWRTSAGLGRIYTYTINHRAANPYMADKLPYAVVVVQLDEGPRMMGNLINTPLSEITIGLRVRTVFEPVSDDITLVHFEAEPATRQEQP